MDASKATARQYESANTLKEVETDTSKTSFTSLSTWSSARIKKEVIMEDMKNNPFFKIGALMGETNNKNIALQETIDSQAAEIERLRSALEGIRTYAESLESGVLAQPRERIITSLLSKTQQALLRAEQIEIDK